MTATEETTSFNSKTEEKERMKVVDNDATESTLQVFSVLFNEHRAKVHFL